MKFKSKIKSKLKSLEKNILHNCYILYIIVFLSVINVFGFMLLNQIDSIIIFALVGFITQFFSKNMIVILSISLITTNLFAYKSNYLETFGPKGNSHKTTQKVNDHSLSNLNLDNPGNINNKETIEQTYSNLDEILNSGSINKMSDATQKLAKRQHKIYESLSKLTPQVTESMKLVEKMGGMDKMTSLISSLSSMIGIDDKKRKNNNSSKQTT